MKYNLMRIYLLAAVIVLAGVVVGHGQGMVVFSGHVDPHGTNYYELGMWFHVAVQPGDYDSMGIIQPNTVNNLATNSTPYLDFFQQLNPNDYVAFSLTNGSTFGLTSVQLADPNSPSPSPVPISFVGFLESGSTVTNIFITPGNNANSLLNYTFTSAFASGLTSVDILSTRWAMDNLVFGNVAAPEPGIESLIAVGLLAFAARKIRNHRLP